MKLNKLGESELRVSEICIGTMTWGEQSSERDAQLQLDFALDHGIGGCPYAPGATGNIVTEDLVFMLESMGLRTGIDIGRLIASRQIVLEALPDEPLYGHVPDAGLTKGFVPASAQRQARG